MENNSYQKRLYNLLIISVFFFSISSVYAQSPPPAVLKTINDLPAADSKVFFSFDTGKTISGADTAGVKWDIAFHRTQTWVNSGSSGKGQTKAILLKNTSFDKVAEAPATGYAEDSTQARAIPTGSGNGWYVYDMNSHIVNPAPGRILVIQTAEGRFVKVEILNYYKDGDGDGGYYTFRYAFLAKAG